MLTIGHKSAYKFNEVTSLTGVKPYVLRFWESEFDQIIPALNEDGQKIYTVKDIEAINKIKKLLFDDRLSIPQAKGYLDTETAQDYEEETVSSEQLLNLSKRSEELKLALNEIINMHKDTVPPTPTQLEVVSLTTETAEAKATQIADTWRQSNGHNEKQIVKLITAKRKLAGVLARMDQLIQNKSW